MKKLVLFLIIFGLSISLCYPANQWRKGTGEDVPLGSEDVSNLDDAIFQRITDPIDRLNSNYREGCEITFNTVSALTIGSGEVMLSNSGGSIRLMQQNTSTTPATFSDLDTGAEASSTTYFVYAVQNTATDSDFDISISLNASAPTGFTYFKRLGSFFNNSSSNIVDDNTIVNDNDYYSLHLGSWVSKSNNVAYLASSDGFFVGILTANDSVSAGRIIAYTDSSNPPTTVRGGCFVWRNEGTASESSTNTPSSFTIPVKKGDYYKGTLTTTLAGLTATYYWIPNE